MESLIQNLHAKGFLDDMPSFVKDNLVLEVLMGSSVYGATTEDSDIDVYAVCLPPQDVMFPYLSGEIPVFDQKTEPFRTYSKHHIMYGDKSYDVKVYSLVHFFRLATDGSPNVLDTLFVPNHAVMFVNELGKALLDAKDMFISKHACTAYLHYAGNKILSGAKAMQKGTPWRKDMYHAVRALLQAEELATTGGMILNSNSEVLLDVRDGTKGFDEFENEVATTYLPKAKEARNKSLLLDVVDEKAIRKLLESFIRPMVLHATTKPAIDEDKLIELKKQLGDTVEMIGELC
jgi:uncharacterized protein